MYYKPQVVEQRVSQAIASAVADAGVPIVLGIAGGYTAPMITAFEEEPRIRALSVRQESVATSMAEAFGRLSGQPLVVIGQGEWLVGNASQSIVEALLGSSPMVLLTEMTDNDRWSHHAPYQAGTADYGVWDAVGALRAMTKQVMVSHHPNQAVQMTQLALKHAISGDPGPVAVVFRRESLRGRVASTEDCRLYHSVGYAAVPVEPSASALDRAAEALRGAEAPVLLAGNGVTVGGATHQLAALARQLDAPVVTTPGGKGAFPEVDPLAAGVMGEYGSPAANRVLGESDVVLAVGTRLSASDTCNANPSLIDPSRQAIVQIDREPRNLGWTFPVSHPVLGDAALALPALGERLADLRGRWAPGGDRIAAATPVPAARPALAVPALPEALIGSFQELWPEDVLVTADAGENRLFMMHWYRARTAPGFLQPAGGGGMGYAVPAAVGAKLAQPHRPVVAVCGDGGFGMSLPAVLTAVQHEIPVGIVVFNNAKLGWVHHGLRGRPALDELPDMDYAGVARSLGAEGVRPGSVEELREALAAVATTRRPMVVDVPLSLDTTYLDVHTFPADA